VTGIGISDDHLLKILGFRLIPVVVGGHLGSKIARTLPNLKGTGRLLQGGRKIEPPPAPREVPASAAH